MISIIGTSLKKLRDDARGAALSPDGSQIVYLDTAHHGAWIMGVDGRNAREWFKAEDGFHLFAPTWLANGKRIAFVKFKTENGKTDLEVESRNLQGTDPVVMFNNPNGVAATHAPGGRLIVSVAEAPPHQYDSNLWEQDYDLETGKPKGSLRRLTDWNGFLFSSLGMTADGKQFVFLNQRMQSAVYLGELANGGNELKSPQRLTLNENLNWPGAWSADSKTVFFYSDRNGSFDIYRQGITERSPAPIVTGPEQKFAPQVSPDGKWALFAQWPPVSDTTTNTGKLMRAPVAGGAPELVMEIQGRPSIGSDPGSTVGGQPSFRCPIRGTDCILGEIRDKQLILSSFDPVKGRIAELAKVEVDPDTAIWDLSPDGTHAAVTNFSYTEANIQIVSLDKSAPQKLSAMPWNELVAIVWAADGKSLFLASYSSRGTAIVHIDLAGHSQMLFKPAWDIFSLAPSPDGKYLAFGPLITNSNAWTIPSFPGN